MATARKHSLLIVLFNKQKLDSQLPSRVVNPEVKYLQNELTPKPNKYLRRLGMRIEVIYLVMS